MLSKNEERIDETKKECAVARTLTLQNHEYTHEHASISYRLSPTVIPSKFLHNLRGEEGRAPVEEVEKKRRLLKYIFQSGLGKTKKNHDGEGIRTLVSEEMKLLSPRHTASWHAPSVTWYLSYLSQDVAGAILQWMPDELVHLSITWNLGDDPLFPTNFPITASGPRI